MAGVWNYQMTNGLGIIEYMEWCDDMKLEPSMSPDLVPNKTAANSLQSLASGLASPLTVTSSRNPRSAGQFSTPSTRSSSSRVMPRPRNGGLSVPLLATRSRGPSNTSRLATKIGSLAVPQVTNRTSSTGSRPSTRPSTRNIPIFKSLRHRQCLMAWRSRMGRLVTGTRT